MTSLWNEATWSYKFGLQRVKLFEICYFSQPVDIFRRTFSLTSFSISVSTVIRKEHDKPLKRSNLILQYSGGISGEIVNSAGLNQVRKFGSQRVRYFEICDFSQQVGWYPREHSWQDSLLYSYRYFPHKPLETTPWVWNQNNRHVRITH